MASSNFGGGFPHPIGPIIDIVLSVYQAGAGGDLDGTT